MTALHASAESRSTESNFATTGAGIIVVLADAAVVTHAATEKITRALATKLTSAPTPIAHAVDELVTLRKAETITADEYKHARKRALGLE
ncbi:hypothetical protein IGS67_08680 [Flavimobilis sp. GY10621]|uniref:Short C-terminal domain-containing protein n=1 Tax=Flavimobilis rhizosphaerae TaxID=2775421 RepID=A0ABR9DQZ6_9MICO|nr:hypothetical protein [Flavimobilis rhizosphaerae]MBD9699562.1 hypothetical protein [Flavimobilis rhizosphaerae]